MGSPSRGSPKLRRFCPSDSAQARPSAQLSDFPRTSSSPRDAALREGPLLLPGTSHPALCGTAPLSPVHALETQNPHTHCSYFYSISTTSDLFLHSWGSLRKLRRAVDPGLCLVPLPSKQHPFSPASVLHLAERQGSAWKHFPQLHKPVWT